MKKQLLTLVALVGLFGGNTYACQEISNFTKNPAACCSDAYCCDCTECFCDCTEFCSDCTECCSDCAKCCCDCAKCCCDCTEELAPCYFDCRKYSSVALNPHLKAIAREKARKIAGQSTDETIERITKNIMNFIAKPDDELTQAYNYGSPFIQTLAHQEINRRENARSESLQTENFAALFNVNELILRVMRMRPIKLNI